MRLHTLVAIGITLTFTTTSFATDALLPRHPAPSPDGSQLVFSWQGDLWLVPTVGGDAQRITVHPANEHHPVWSRDGQMIAFASDRHGNSDVFSMPSDGSAAPTRLTFTSMTEILVGARHRSRRVGAPLPMTHPLRLRAGGTPASTMA